MVTHPHDPDTAYIFPLEREMRVGPEGKARVYRTRNAGKSWEALTKGLPQKAAYETVLRDGMAADNLKPAGIYFGTRTGKLYGSANEGGSWQLIVEGLPPITCVKAAMVDGETAGPAKAARAAAGGRRRPRRRGRSGGKRPTAEKSRFLTTVPAQEGFLAATGFGMTPSLLRSANR